MNVEAIQNELVRRLRKVVEQVYPYPQPSPDFPSAVLSFPNVITYHSNLQNTLAHMEIEVRMYAGRGDTDDALVELSRWLSTDTDKSVKRALESKDPSAPDPMPWYRLAVGRTSELSTQGDSYSVQFAVEIHA